MFFFYLYFTALPCPALFSSLIMFFDQSPCLKPCSAIPCVFASYDCYILYPFFCRLRYEERAPLAQNPLGRQLFELMARKQTNLSVAADVETADDMLSLADAVGPHVAVLKTHVDVFSTWTEEHAAKLRELADKHGALYFLEKRKRKKNLLQYFKS
jgi:hypothetical protein